MKSRGRQIVICLPRCFTRPVPQKLSVDVHLGDQAMT
jgi:hypothetical protein